MMPRKGNLASFMVKAIVALAVMLLAQAEGARAGYQSATHIFNVSNAMPAGNYGTVKVEAYTGLAGTTNHGLNPGQVRMTVDAPFLPIYGDPVSAANFGIDKFAFNTDLTIAAGQIKVATTSGTDLNWAVQYSKNISTFGTFSILDKGDGNSRGDPIVVTVSDLGGDALLPHFVLPNSDGMYYVAHVAGFPNSPTSHYIAVAPEPSSAMLGLLAMTGLSWTGWRRRRQHG